MRYKNRPKDKHCIKLGPCGKDPSLDCKEYISYKKIKPEWYNL